MFIIAIFPNFGQQGDHQHSNYPFSSPKKSERGYFLAKIQAFRNYFTNNAKIKRFKLYQENFENKNQLQLVTSSCRKFIGRKIEINNHLYSIINYALIFFQFSFDQLFQDEFFDLEYYKIFTK